MEVTESMKDAYYNTGLIAAVNVLYYVPRSLYIKHFMLLLIEYYNMLECLFVPYPSQASLPLVVLHSKHRLIALPTNIRLGWKSQTVLKMPITILD